MTVGNPPYVPDGGNWGLTLEIEQCHRITVLIGWSVEIFLIGQNRSTNQRSGMILEVQIQIFGAHVKVFIFKKFQGAQILIFFCENWHEASFYIKEQKACVWFFEKNPPKNVFFMFRL